MQSSTAPLPINKPVTILAALALLGGYLAIANFVPNGKASLYLLGGLMGIALYHAAFGFTSGWREFIVNARGHAVRVQLATFGLTALLVMPFLSSGELFDHGVIAAAAPVGIAMLLGAFIFGFGMQLAGGCASGTLYTVGGGSTRMLITLAFFIAGSVIGSAHLPWWFKQPKFETIALVSDFGLWPALFITLLSLVFFASITITIERFKHGKISTGKTLQNNGRSAFSIITRGRWPLIWGGIALALGNFAVFAISGHTWSISFGFTLWGAKSLALMGIDLSQTEFWTWGYPSRALKASLFAEDTSSMNFGILVGAALASGLAGKFGSIAKIPLLSVLAAIIGGLLMGYGARLASGCNVGALFSGIASGSLHGWAWLIAGFSGSILGVKARTIFNL